ncbi:unnamed protein product [Moneuplotes crassus]|uniref:Kinesin motor domain-containing protein n=1 Tax=Euplotes crassus TaxID=5936 RepID=A0AAD2D5L6_EUPCR|nr:unnamed protein product [Moneuplotes crassus]
MEQNINVSIRLKPLRAEEAKDERNLQWREVGGDTLIMTTEHKSESYQFDHVFDGDKKTRDIFSTCILNQILSALNGINISVLVYGQTSSGKTHTMQGSQEERGIIPLSISAIFQKLNHIKANFKMRVSYLEIYNETINDLLNEENKNLDFRINPQTGDTFVKNLSEEEVCDEASSFEWLERGEAIRQVAATAANHCSSRSHTIFTIKLEIIKDKIVQKSDIVLVDLAGSESAGRAESKGMRFKEGVNINKSLLSLSNTISSLSKPSRSKYNGFRESKLTRILEKSLSGNSKTFIICTISQLYKNQFESCNTIKFGIKAKSMKTTIIENRNSLSSKEMSVNPFLKQMNDDKKRYKERIQDLEEQLQYRIFHPDQEVDEDPPGFVPEYALTEYILQQRINFLELKIDELICENSMLNNNQAEEEVSRRSPTEREREYSSIKEHKHLKDSLKHSNSNINFLKSLNEQLLDWLGSFQTSEVHRKKYKEIKQSLANLCPVPVPESQSSLDDLGISDEHLELALTVDDLKREISELQDKKDILEREVELANDILDQERTDCGYLFDEFEQKIADQEREKTSMILLERDYKEKAEAKIRDLSRSVSRFTKRNQVLQKKLKKRTDEATLIKQQLDDKHKECALLKSSVRSLQEKELRLNEMESNYKKCQFEIARMAGIVCDNQQLQEKAIRLEEMNSTLTQKLNKHRAESLQTQPSQVYQRRKSCSCEHLSRVLKSANTVLKSGMKNIKELHEVSDQPKSIGKLKSRENLNIPQFTKRVSRMDILKEQTQVFKDLQELLSKASVEDIPARSLQPKGQAKHDHNNEKEDLCSILEQLQSINSTIKPVAF